MDIYKKSEGKIVRRAAFVSLLFLIVWGFKELGKWLAGFEFGRELLFGDPDDPFLLPFYEMPLRVGVAIAIVLTLICGWQLWKILNRPRTADLLIETETELKKVSWPSWEDARQSTVIVLVFVVAVTGYLMVVEAALKRIFDLVLS